MSQVAEAGLRQASFCRPPSGGLLLSGAGAVARLEYRHSPARSGSMKKLFLVAIALALCATLAACEKQSAARAERSKPRVSVTTQAVQIRRAPAPNVEITPEGRLRMDDIEVPLPDARRERLQLLFGHLQMLRQEALATAPADPNNRGVPLQSNAQVDALRDELLRDVPTLAPYRESFNRITAERR